MSSYSRLAIAMFVACRTLLGIAIAQEGEVPATIRKAWEEREKAATNVELTFKGTVNYFVPEEDEDGVSRVPTLLPRTGKLVYSGTKMLFEEKLRPNGPEETMSEKRFNGKLTVNIARGKGMHYASLHKEPARVVEFEFRLHPLFWTLRPSTSILGKWGPRKLLVEETTLPTVDGKCYMLAEEPVKGKARYTFWIHEASATLRQVEYATPSESRARFTFTYDRKDFTWVPTSWTQLDSAWNGKAESQTDFYIESIKLPSSIDPSVFEFAPEPGMRLADLTVTPYRMYDIDEQGKKVPRQDRDKK